MDCRRLSVVAGSVVALAAACLLLFGTTAGRASAAAPCWQRVIADWSDNGRIDHTYPLECYRAAVAHLPEDLRAYSSAPAEIDRALAERRVALPASAKAAVTHATVHDAGPAGLRLATLVPSAAGILAAAGVALWLLRLWRPSHRR